jgi:hypothetical protein
MRISSMLVAAFPMHVDSAEIESDLMLASYSILAGDCSYYICGVALFPEAIYPHPLIHFTGDAILMVREIG